MMSLICKVKCFYSILRSGFIKNKTRPQTTILSSPKLIHSYLKFIQDNGIFENFQSFKSTPNLIQDIEF